MDNDWANVDMEAYRMETELRQQAEHLKAMAISAIKYIDSLGGEHLANALTIQHRAWWEYHKRLRK